MVIILSEEKRKLKLIEYLNYKDILIILASWYLMIIVLLITKELDLGHRLVTDIFHFLFILSGRFICFSLLVFYLTSLYPIEFKDLGLNFSGFKKGLISSFSIILLLVVLVIALINIPLSFMVDIEFSPLIMVIGPDAFISSILPFTLIFIACLFISLSEQFILNVIIFELFNYTLLNRLISFILSSLIYSVIIVELIPNRIILNTLVAMISILLYQKKRSIIPATIFMAAYYSSYITYIYGWEFIRF